MAFRFLLSGKTYGIAMLGLAAFLTAAPQSPAQAQGYEGLMESQHDTYGIPSRGQGNQDGGGYDGLVGWQAQQSATNPYGTTPSGDIYQYVRGSAASIGEQRELQKQARELQRQQRQQQILDGNLKRAADLQSKLDEENQARQMKLLEQQAEIMQRMQRQQQQQQQQRR